MIGFANDPVGSKALAERHGIEISRKTMGGWMAQCAELLDPLLDPYVQGLQRRRADDAILDEPVKKQAYSPMDSIYEIEADLLTHPHHARLLPLREPA